MANEMNYELRGDGILFYLRDGISALVAYRTTVRHRVELWKGENLLPADVGDISSASFRKRLAKAAAGAFGEVPHLEEDLGRVSHILEKKIDSEDDEADGKTLGGLLKGMFGPSVTGLLVQYGSEAELFHDPEGEPYATVEVEGHHETWPLKSRGFKNWLRHRYYTAQKEDDQESPGAPRAQALNDALAQLEAKCQFEGPEHPVHVRVAEKDGAIYIDLADEEWRAIEVAAGGWRVVSSDAPPVKFRRARGMLPLPVPEKGDADRLRALVNLEDDDHDGWRLLLAWLVQALRPKGPYPVLILQGEQGSAKSTIERLLRALVDPSTAPLRSTPRNEHDLFIAATSAWVVAFDNISTLPPWLSDALCRLSTGGGFSTRTLYENREQELFDAMRPVILNGISDVATRPDLLDRAIVLTLPSIPEEERKPESEMWEHFDRERPAIFGALLDAASTALRELPSTKLSSMPRMADFALWATAAESGFGWESGTFMKAYSGNRREANDLALETDPVAGAVFKLMAGRDEWSGGATELWKALGEEVDEDVKHTKAWPAAPQTLTGRLKRLAPALRKAGIEYLEDREGHNRTRVKRLRRIPAKERPRRPQRPQGGKDLQNEEFECGRSADASEECGRSEAGHADATRDRGRSADASAFQERPQEMPANDGIFADADAADASLKGFENTESGFSENGASRGGESASGPKQPLSADLEPGQSAMLSELKARRNGGLSVEAVLGELKSETPSRRMLNRYLSTTPDKRTETSFEYLAKTVIYTLVDLPASDKDAWKEYAPVVKEALKDWEEA